MLMGCRLTHLEGTRLGQEGGCTMGMKEESITKSLLENAARDPVTYLPNVQDVMGFPVDLIGV